MPPRGATSSSRALAAILPQIQEGHAYEAHQKARTFAARYVKSGHYDTAIDVLFQSARELLKAGQIGSGTDLAKFLLEVYDEDESQAVNDDSKGRLTQLIALTGSAGSWRKSLIDKSLAWSVKSGEYPTGDPDLHHYVGELLYKDGAFDQAEPHFLSAGKRDSARLLAQMMCEWWQAAAPSSSPGPFAIRGTLPYLLNGNILAARTFITHFVSITVSKNSSLRSSLASSPLPVPSSTSGDEVQLTTDPNLNFLQLAVRTCQRANGAASKKAQEAWIRLVGAYANKGGPLAQPEHLNELATLYFGFPPPRGGAGNPMADMMASFFGGGGSGAASRPRVIAPPTAAAGLD